MKLARETAKACQAASELQRLKEEHRMLETQFATKQETLDDLMEEVETLQVCARPAYMRYYLHH